MISNSSSSSRRNVNYSTDILKSSSFQSYSASSPEKILLQGVPRKFAENKLLKKICEILFTFTVEITFHFDDTFFSQKTIFKIVPNLMDTLYNIHASPQKKHVMQV